MVLMDAIERAGTVVCEPMMRVHLEVPVWATGALQAVLGRLGCAVHDQVVRGDLTTLTTVVAAARLPRLQRQLPGITAGEGVLESTFDGYRPVAGPPPVRRRTTVDPRQRKDYLLSLTRHAARGQR
jgi:ribosomal protection tetracycline resistance protein